MARKSLGIISLSSHYKRYGLSPAVNPSRSADAYVGIFFSKKKTYKKITIFRSLYT